MAQTPQDWRDPFRSWHDAAVQQARKVNEILAACDRDEPNSLTLQAIRELAVEQTLLRSALSAIRVGIETGVLGGPSET